MVLLHTHQQILTESHLTSQGGTLVGPALLQTNHRHLAIVISFHNDGCLVGLTLLRRSSHNGFQSYSQRAFWNGHLTSQGGTLHRSGSPSFTPSTSGNGHLTSQGWTCGRFISPSFTPIASCNSRLTSQGCLLCTSGNPSYSSRASGNGHHPLQAWTVSRSGSPPSYTPMTSGILQQHLPSQGWIHRRSDSPYSTFIYQQHLAIVIFTRMDFPQVWLNIK